MSGRRGSKFGLAGRRGVALVLALWVLVLLSFTGLEMSVFSRSDTGSTRYLKERLQTYYLARGGVERGIGVVAGYYQRFPSSALMAKVRGLELSTATGPRLPLLTYLSDRRLQAVPLGGGTFSLRFEDLSGRVNVNRADPDLLVNLIQLAGLDRSRAEEIADGILDWIDADDLHRGRGAEADYYARRGLAAPRNAPVLRLDELLRVKGMTRDVLYGGGRLAGLTPFLTTEGSGKINVNTAPREVLLAIPGMDDFTVTRILADRERRHLRSLEDVLGREAAARLAANPLLGILSFDATEMRIEAVGELPGSNTRSRVAATVGILPAGVIVRSWQDDVQASAPLAPAAEILLPESS